MVPVLVITCQLIAKIMLSKRL